MMRWVRRLLATGLCTLLLCGGLQAAAHAGVGRVSGLHVGAQDRCAGTLRVKWHAVKGATYQVRWASSRRGLGGARPLSVARRAASVGPVSTSGTSFVQVRAVRHGKTGGWSKVGKARFGSSRFGQPCDLSGHGVPGGVQFTWGATPGATGYRVRWSAAPFGKWPETATYVSGWLPGSARSSVFGVPGSPQTGDHMLGVAYANPVWGQLEARNKRGTVRHSQGFVPVFPTPPDPGSGVPLRIGTYNVMTAPAGPRAHAIAANISQHGLGVVALQESNTATAQAVVGELGGDWTYVSYQNTPQQILYRSGSYVVDNRSQGTIDVHNYATGGTIVTPWVRLKPATDATGAHSFYVVSAHFQENPNSSALEKKQQTGLDAQAVMAGINAANGAGRPVIVAGDLHYLREPFSDVPGYVEAPPTFVRGGYYDAMAAVTKTNIGYQTFNAGNGTTAPHQDFSQSGVAPRADYIMLKGFRSSNAYVNVANWSLNGLTPSDHNLVYADVTVPFPG
jgi:hypothetical protein